MAPSGRRVDGLSHVAMGSSEMVRFALQFQATGTWKEVKVTLSHKQLETFVWIQTKGRKKQRDFLSPAAKICPGSAPGVPLTLASISEVSFLSGEVIRLKMCHRHGAQVTKRATPPSSSPPGLPGGSPAEDPPPAPPYCQSSEVSEAAPVTSTVQFFVSKYISKEKLEMKSPATKRALVKGTPIPYNDGVVPPANREGEETKETEALLKCVRPRIRAFVPRRKTARPNKPAQQMQKKKKKENTTFVLWRNTFTILK